MTEITQTNIGIVGLGYVGHALRNAMELGIEKSNDATARTVYPYTLFTYDINEETHPTEKSLDDVVHKSDIIFVCVPTPMKSTGECDTSIVEQVVHDIAVRALSHKIIVIKSTVPPGTTSRLQSFYPSHSILFNPEFLTEANYKHDFLRGDVIIGKPMYTAQITADFVGECISHIIRIVNVHYVKIFVVTAEEAEMFKYVANLFLATKVSFANEMYHAAKELGVNWNNLQSLIFNDGRLGTTHWNVPGPDGRFGFGGSCFPKDLAAMLYMMKNHLGVPSPLLQSVWDRNTITDRPEKDWELLKGRSVVE